MDTNQISKIEHGVRIIAPEVIKSGTKFDALVKRIFDIICSCLGLILLSPIFIGVAIMLKRESRGPVFYRGPRVGKDGKNFGILKFRTMFESPESYQGPKITASEDSRITPTGRWLRNTKINELPQLWNVLKGEMSLVGPRPEDPDIALTWPEDARRIILSIRPGITSPASVAYYDEEKKLSSPNFMDDYMGVILPDKLRLDCLYVRHHSILADLDAIFWTLIVLVPRFSKKPVPEGSLFGGPLSRAIRTNISWFVIDFLVAFTCVGLVGLGYRAFIVLDIGIFPAVIAAALLAFLFGLINALLDLKRVVWSRATPEDIIGLFISCAIVGTIGMILEFVFHWQKFPDGFMAISSVAVLLGFVVSRYRFRLITGIASRWANFRGTGYGTGERVLIVGAGKGGEFATWLLRRQDFLRMFTIIGYVDDDPRKQGMRLDGLDVLGSTEDIPNLAKEHDIGVIFYAIGRETKADYDRIIRLCKLTGAHVVAVEDILGTLMTQLSSPARTNGNT